MVTPRACAIQFASVPPSVPRALLPASPPAGPTLLYPAARVQHQHAPRRPSPGASALWSVLPPRARCACTPRARSVWGGWRRGAPGGALPRMLAHKGLWNAYPLLCVLTMEGATVGGASTRSQVTLTYGLAEGDSTFDADGFRSVLPPRTIFHWWGRSPASCPLTLHFVSFRKKLFRTMRKNCCA